MIPYRKPIVLAYLVLTSGAAFLLLVYREDKAAESERKPVPGAAPRAEKNSDLVDGRKNAEYIGLIKNIVVLKTWRLPLMWGRIPAVLRESHYLLMAGPQEMPRWR